MRLSHTLSPAFDTVNVARAAGLGPAEGLEMERSPTNMRGAARGPHAKNTRECKQDRHLRDECPEKILKNMGNHEFGVARCTNNVYYHL